MTDMHRSLTYVALLAALGCDVYPLGAGPTGIANLDDIPEDACGRGFLLASSDYQSSNVSAFDRQGNELSPCLASSGQSAAELVQAFSGDVVFPSERQRGSAAIVIDRYPQSVLSLVDLATAKIPTQIDVSTGFAANPHDALRLDDGRLLVTRFDSNLNPGRLPNDAGGDLLVLDAAKRQIVSRIDLRPATPRATDRLLPHPDRMLQSGSVVYVVVSLYSPNYQTTGASYLVSLDRHTLGLVGSIELADVAGCAGLSLSPDATELAIACSGSWWGSAHGARPETSGLIGVDVTATPMLRWKLLAKSLSPALPFGFSVAYASNTRVVAVALGHRADANQNAESDRFVSYDVKTQVTRTIYVEAGAPFTLGDVRCLARCGRCALTRANGRGQVKLFQNDEAGLSSLLDLPSDERLGLPPRWLGTF